MFILRQKRIEYLAIAFACLLAASSVSGALLTVEVTGTVDASYELDGFAFDGSIQIGTPMVGRCTYDSDVPDQNPDPYGAWYSVSSVSMEVGNYLFYKDPLGQPQRQPRFEVLLGADGGGYFVYNPGCWFDGSIFVNGSPTDFDEVELSTGMSLIDLAASTGHIPDDSLPTSFPPISVFDARRQWSITLFRAEMEGGGWLSMGGEITDIRVIPEPACVLLLGLGGVFLRRREISAPDGSRKRW